MPGANVQFINRPQAQFDAGYSAYISGPMRGKPELNRHAFNAVQRRMVERGWVVYNPANKINTGEHSNLTPYQSAIREDVEMLLKSKGIVLLPGWRQSEGARFEVEVARNFGLDFWEAERHSGGYYTINSISVPEAGAEGIDAEARRLVYGDRAATYGHPRGDFDRVAKMWGAILNTEVNAEQVAIMMVAFKLARLSQTPTHHDSQVDTIGYMLCLARLQEDPNEAAAWQARDDHWSDEEREREERIKLRAEADADSAREALEMLREKTLKTDDGNPPEVAYRPRESGPFRGEVWEPTNTLAPDPYAGLGSGGRADLGWAGTGFDKAYVEPEPSGEDLYGDFKPKGPFAVPDHKEGGTK